MWLLIHYSIEVNPCLLIKGVPDIFVNATFTICNIHTVDRKPTSIFDKVLRQNGSPDIELLYEIKETCDNLVIKDTSRF